MAPFVVLGVGLVTVILFLVWMLSGGESHSGVIDVRETPEKQVEELTVEELHEHARNLLVTRGYQLESTEEAGDYLAKRGGEQALVTVDPAARFRDPRKMNKLILNLRKSDSEWGIIVTTRSLPDQCRALADKADIEIIDPEKLINGFKE